MSYSVTLSGNTFDVSLTASTFDVTLSQVGQQGQAGADGAALVYEGAWATSTAYTVDDLVTNNGSTYACIADHTSSATDEPGVGVNTATYWTLFVAKGADGTDGVDGTNGTNGTDGTGWTGGSYNAATGVVTFTSDDGLGFTTDDLRGADGSDGVDGANGTDGTDGVSFIWQGAWITATAYAANDVVENDGSSYICILGHTSSASDEPGVGVNTATYWELVAQKGADGVGAGTVTSIDITGGTGITSTGGPVTSSGAITVALDAATQTSLSKADTALQPAAIGTTVQGYSAVLDATTASFTTADETKLDGIEAGATADQTGAEIKAAYEGEADTNAYTDAEKSKLAGIEASADVTDTANVTAAGALMDSEVTNLAAVKAFDPTDYATAAQGSTADTALQPGDDADALGSGTASDGQVLTADGAGGAAWEDVAAAGVPSGCILMWSGSIATIPSGWALCDGANGTPNLAGRFVVHADADSGGTYNPGNTGGADSVTLTAAQIPSHTHSFSGSTNTTGAHTHSYDKPGTRTVGGGFQAGVSDSSFSSTSTSSGGNHSHTFSGTTGSAGSGNSHENRPPYYALAYIMKL